MVRKDFEATGPAGGSSAVRRLPFRCPSGPVCVTLMLWIVHGYEPDQVVEARDGTERETPENLRY